MKDEITIIVNSCDKYEDLWYPFFELFRIQWPECEYPIILNNESKEYSHPNKVGGGITCLKLFENQPNVDWSTRLIRTLDYVETDYVIMILDDEFIQAPVDTLSLNNVIRDIKRNPFISCILFTPLFKNGTNEITSIMYRNYNLIKRIRRTQSTANAAIWKKARLEKYLKAGETVWEFETYSKRRRGLFDLMYTIKENESPIRTSFMITSGFGLVKGKWLWKNKELFQKNNIDIDFSDRGVIEEAEVNEYMTDYWQKRRTREALEKQAPTKAKIIAFVKQRYDVAPEWLRTIAQTLWRVVKPLRKR